MVAADARLAREAKAMTRREVYPDFAMKHFHEVASEKHKLKLSYTLTRSVLQDAGLVEKAPGRGKYRRKRERRPMVGLMVHLDASTHTWLKGLPLRDLMVALDDADGRILYARFVEQESTGSTFEALHAVLTRQGRFAELYTDRGSHFCRTPKADGPAVTDGQVSRALKTLGIRQILARSPEARGRSERAFKTIQGRLPQELRVARIRDCEAANEYLERVFVPDFNKRFHREARAARVGLHQARRARARPGPGRAAHPRRREGQHALLRGHASAAALHEPAGPLRSLRGDRPPHARRRAGGGPASTEGRVETRQPTGHHRMLMTRT
jgi:hypothetical protein